MKIHLTAEQVILLRDLLREHLRVHVEHPAINQLYDQLTKNILLALDGGQKVEKVAMPSKASPDADNLKDFLFQKFLDRQGKKIDDLKEQLENVKKDADFMVPDVDDKFDDFGYPRKGWKRPPPPYIPQRGKRHGHFK